MTPREAASLAEAMRDTRGAVADLLKHGRWTDSAAAAEGAEVRHARRGSPGLGHRCRAGFLPNSASRYGPALLDSTIREALRIAVTRR